VCPKAVAPWATAPGEGNYLAVTNILYKVQSQVPSTVQ